MDGGQLGNSSWPPVEELNVAAHLQVQVTLLAAKAGGPGRAMLPGEHPMTLAAASRRFRAVLMLNETAEPGGLAVHAAVTFQNPSAVLSSFPRGTQFELWGEGRVGYGTVLATKTS